MIPQLPQEYTANYDPRSNSPESTLLHALLNPPAPPTTTSTIHVLKGMGGTGKTTTLIALARHPQVARRFTLRYFITLGQHADTTVLLSHLAELLRLATHSHTAQTMLRLSAIPNNHYQAIAFAVSQLTQHSILLVIDDIWVAPPAPFHSHPSVFDLIRHLVLGVATAPHTLSVLLSSREDAVALILPSIHVVESSHLPARSLPAQKIICAYAGFSLAQEVPHFQPHQRQAFHHILDYCDGLQLVLAVAGKNIRERVAYGHVPRHEAWLRFSHDLRDSSLLLRDSSPSHTSASVMTVVKSSLNTVERLFRRWGPSATHPLDIDLAFVSLGVIKKQRDIPWICLQLLWNCDETTARRFAETLAQVNLISLHPHRGIWLHPRIHDYCTDNSEYHAYFHALHSIFLSRLFQRLTDLSPPGSKPVRVRAVREWWSLTGPDSVLNDYIADNVLWHLLRAKLFAECLGVISDYRWTEARVNRSSNASLVSGIEADIKLVLATRRIHWPQAVETGLRYLFEAVRLSSHYVSRNPRELAFQIHARLAHKASSNDIVARYIWSLKSCAQLPWLCASRGVLQPVSDTVKGKASFDVPLECAAVIPKSSKIVIGGATGFLVIFDLASAITERTLRGHERLVRDVKVSRGNMRIYSVSSDNTVRSWDIETGAQQSLFRDDKTPSCCELTPDGKYLVVGWKEGYISILDTQKLELVREWKAHKAGLRCVRVDAQSRAIFSAGSEGTVKRWQYGDETVVSTLLDRMQLEHKARDLSLHRDQNKMAAAIGFSAFVFSTATGHVLRSCVFENWKVLYVQFAPKGEDVYLAMEDGTIRLLREDGKVETLARSHNSRLTRILLSEDRDTIVSISADTTISTLKCDRPADISRHDTPEMNRLANLAVFPRQMRVLMAWEYGPRGLWQVDLGSTQSHNVADELWNPQNLVKYVQLLLLPRRQGVVTLPPARDPGPYDIHDPQSGSPFPLALVACQGQTITYLAVSPDEKHVAAAVAGGRIMLFDSSTWTQRTLDLSLPGHITCLSFSADSRLLAGCSTLASVRAWTVLDGAPVRLTAPEMHPDDRVWVLSFNQESSGLVAITDREPLRVAHVHSWARLDTRQPKYHVRTLESMVDLRYISIGVSLYVTERHFVIQSDRGEGARGYDFTTEARMTLSAEQDVWEGIIQQYKQACRPGRVHLNPFSRAIHYNTDKSGGIVLGTLESNPCHSLYPDQWVYAAEDGWLVAGGKLRKLVVGRCVERREGCTLAPLLPPLRESVTRTAVRTGRQASVREFEVFISHAGPDKMDMAVPLHDKLWERDISSFVDIEGILPGEDSAGRMEWAVASAKVGVFILSPEFVARRWPMKELSAFLKRVEQAERRRTKGPSLIPVFYRVSLQECREYELYRVTGREGESVLQREGFYGMERQRERTWDETHEALKRVAMFRGVENDHGVGRGDKDGKVSRNGRETVQRELLLDTVADFVERALAGEVEAERGGCGVA